MITDAELAALTPEERDELAGRLASTGPDSWVLRRWVTVVATGACVALVPWIAVLAITLPRHYTASHWRLTWIGLDTAMAYFLARTAWLSYRRQRRPAAVSALITATLLSVDAWFDVVTATGWPDRSVSLASAVFGELPLAIFLGVVASRTLHSAIVPDRPPPPEPPGQG